jgi:hypothetical protein
VSIIDCEKSARNDGKEAPPAKYVACSEPFFTLGCKMNSLNETSQMGIFKLSALNHKN